MANGFYNLCLGEQVFFRAGVLGQMEELRDDRLSKIMSWMQAYIRGYLSRKEFKKIQEQRSVIYLDDSIIISNLLYFNLH